MLRFGCWVLTIWSALNLFVSLKIVLVTLAYGQHTPALYLILDESDVTEMPAEVLATIDSIAVFANGLNVAFCVLTLSLLWGGLARSKVWSFPPLLLGLFIAWLAGVGADFAVGNAAPWVNVVSLAILALGISSAAFGLFGAPNLNNTNTTE